MGGRCQFKGQTHSGGEQEWKSQWALRLSGHTRPQTPVWNPYATKTPFRSQFCQRAARRYETQQVSVLSSALSQSLDRNLKTHTFNQSEESGQKTFPSVYWGVDRFTINSKLINKAETLQSPSKIRMRRQPLMSEVKGDQRGSCKVIPALLCWTLLNTHTRSTSATHETLILHKTQTHGYTAEMTL